MVSDASDSDESQSAYEPGGAELVDPNADNTYDAFPPLLGTKKFSFKRIRRATCDAPTNGGGAVPHDCNQQ